MKRFSPSVTCLERRDLQSVISSPPPAEPAPPPIVYPTVTVPDYRWQPAYQPAVPDYLDPTYYPSQPPPLAPPTVPVILDPTSVELPAAEIYPDPVIKPAWNGPFGP